MRIFIHSTSVDDIRQAADAGLVDGITVELSELADGGGDAEIAERTDELARTFGLPVCVPVPALAGGEIYRAARELSRISDQVIVQIPFMEDAVIPIRRLVADGIRVSATHVYSGAQAFLAAKIGATMVAVPADDLDAHGQHSARVVAEVRDVIDQSDVECDLAAAAPRSSNHFTECLLAGADIICVTPAFLQQLFVHALTDRGVDRFLRDLTLARRPRSV